MASSPSPKLTKTTTSTASQVQTLNNRLAALVPTLTTTLSPSTVYQPGIGTNYINAFGNPGSAFSVVNQIGVWVAPQINGSAAAYEVQVECFGGGGGGGGGSATAGGGGGGGGEYACETAYTVIPGKSYVWISGGGGTPGAANSTGFTQPGSPGALTQFDIAGVGLPDGVVANGGLGGDSVNVGSGGVGGSGSENTVHYNGGRGGTNLSGIASDFPILLGNATALWTPAATVFPQAWYILDDNTHATNKLSDAASGNDATVTSYSGGLATGSPPGNIVGAPVQVPTATSAAGVWGTNPTIASACVRFQIGSINSASAKIQCPSFTFAGSYLTLSGWTKPDPSGVFGNNQQGAFGTVVANCNYPNGTPAGTAVYWRNLGTASTPNWALNATVSNGTTTYTAQYVLGVATPGVWTQFVMVYNHGVLNLYVDGTLANSVTTTAFTSVPAGKYGMCMGVNPANTQNFYFGYLSNLWFVSGNAELLAGVAQAYGSTPADGGAAGGSSASPGGTGTTGNAPSGPAGGLITQPPAVPSTLSTTRTAGGAGYPGSATGTSNLGGIAGTGGGGGAAGNSSPAPPIGGELVIPFATAASYCGTDSGANAGAIFSPNQQTTSGVLFSGGAAADTASGTKNSLLVIPPGSFSGFKTGAGQNKVATQILLTLHNANPASEITTIVPIGYSYDTSLPTNYQGASLVEYVGYLAIPPGATTVTIDLTQSYFTQGVSGSFGSVPSAIVLGPGSAANLTSNPYYGYNTSTGNAFYSQVYGPGATDSANNSLAPYLTVVYTVGTGSIVTNTAPIFLGTFGGQGLLKMSLVNNESTPVAGLQPYTTTDGGGNQFAQGYTGPVTAFQPGSSPAVPETWHKLTVNGSGSSWTDSGVGINGFYYKMLSTGDMMLSFDITTTAAVTNPLNALPLGYRPTTNFQFCVGYGNTGGPATDTAAWTPGFKLESSGVLQQQGFGPITGNLNVFGTVIVPMGTL